MVEFDTDSVPDAGVFRGFLTLLAAVEQVRVCREKLIVHDMGIHSIFAQNRGNGKGGL